MDAPAAPPDGAVPERPPVPGWRAVVRRRAVTVAVLAVAVVAALAWRIGARAELAAFAWLGAAGSVLAVVDIAVKRLPDPIVLPSYGIGAALLGAAVPFTGGGGARFLHALIGMAALFAWFGLQWLIRPSAVGQGDVKLAGVLGLHLGWLGSAAWVLGVLATAVLGAAVSGALLAARRARRTSAIPYGPFMLAGALVAVLVHAP